MPSRLLIKVSSRLQGQGAVHATGETDTDLISKVSHVYGFFYAQSGYEQDQGEESESEAREGAERGISDEGSISPSETNDRLSGVSQRF